jgi:hypothetical protein
VHVSFVVVTFGFFHINASACHAISFFLKIEGNRDGFILKDELN